MATKKTKKTKKLKKPKYIDLNNYITMPHEDYVKNSDPDLAYDVERDQKL